MGNKFPCCADAPEDPETAKKPNNLTSEKEFDKTHASLDEAGLLLNSNQAARSTFAADPATGLVTLQENSPLPKMAAPKAGILKQPGPDSGAAAAGSELGVAETLPVDWNNPDNQLLDNAAVLQTFAFVPIPKTGSVHPGALGNPGTGFEFNAHLKHQRGSSVGTSAKPAKADKARRNSALEGIRPKKPHHARGLSYEQRVAQERNLEKERHKVAVQNYNSNGAASDDAAQVGADLAQIVSNPRRASCTLTASAPVFVPRTLANDPPPDGSPANHAPNPPAKEEAPAKDSPDPPAKQETVTKQHKQEPSGGKVPAASQKHKREPSAEKLPAAMQKHKREPSAEKLPAAMQKHKRELSTEKVLAALEKPVRAHHKKKPSPVDILAALQKEASKPLPDFEEAGKEEAGKEEAGKEEAGKEEAGKEEAGKEEARKHGRGRGRGRGRGGRRSSRAEKGGELGGGTNGGDGGVDAAPKRNKKSKNRRKNKNREVGGAAAAGGGGGVGGGENQAGV